MANEKIKEYVEMMEAIAEKAIEDQEYAHIQADNLLCNFLYELGYSELVDIYDTIDKWYA